MKALFSRFARISFLLTFLVILAGSVVRTTQSGMGCPDWPRCFGYYIPPTDTAQLEFTPKQTYRKGMMIIRNDTLWRAVGNFQAESTFNRTDWEKYPKHDYAQFEVSKTWIEYVNRLLGALMGLFVFGLFITSFSYVKQKPLLTILAAGMLLLTGFQAWLGALVVSSNLAPVKITTHMLAAVALLALIQLIMHRTLEYRESNRAMRERFLRNMFLVTLILTITQILLGTRVRESVDVVANSLNYTQRETWIDQLSLMFYVHRSFSILLLLFNAWLIFRTFRSSNNRAMRFATLSGFLIFLELVVGVMLNYAGFPAAAQPFHLLLSMMIFSAQFEAWLSLKENPEKTA